MLVKFISPESVEPYKGLVEVDGVVYTNNEEKARKAGFKPLVIDDYPVLSEGFYASLYYEDTTDTVFGRWKEEIVKEVI